MSKPICPMYVRKISSYRYAAIKCKNYLGSHKGEIEEWSPEEREKYMEKHCCNDFKECYRYENLTTMNGRS